MGYDLEMMPVVSNFLYCLVSQTKMPVSEKGSHVIKRRNSHTAANTLNSALFTHVRPFNTCHVGMLAHCKQGLECSSFFLMKVLQSIACSTLFEIEPQIIQNSTATK